MSSTRFIENEDEYLKYAWNVFERYFNSEESFLKQYHNIPDQQERNDFLKIACYYLFFVREGTVTSPNYQAEDLKLVDQTYKYVAIISFIESLCGGKNYVEFYQWLMGQKNLVFPINDHHDLTTQYEVYIADYGSKSRVVQFFRSLDRKVIQHLHNSFIILEDNGTGELDEVDKTLDYLVNFLYQIRSDFVHKGELITEFGSDIVWSERKKKQLVSTMDFESIMRVFEMGFLNHFGITPDLIQI